jgi:hypothetical protein
MPIKNYSDRGSLKDLAKKQEEVEDPPTPFELRLQKLHALAEVSKNQQLADSLGFIVMQGSGDKSSYPITLFRHREYINSLNAKLGDQIEKAKLELEEYFQPLARQPMEILNAQYRQGLSRQTILEPDELVKTASADEYVPAKRSFKRVS